MELLNVSDELKKWLEEHPNINYGEMMIHFDKLIDENDQQETPDNLE